MVEIITDRTKDNILGIHRHVSTPFGNIDFIILTNLVNEDNILDTLHEEVLHFILHREFDFKTSIKLHNILRYIQEKDKVEFGDYYNLLKVLKSYPLLAYPISSNIIRKGKKRKVKVCSVCGNELDELNTCFYCDLEQDYDNVFWELEEDGL